MMGVEHIKNVRVAVDAEIVAIADPVAGSLEWAKGALESEPTVYADSAALAKAGLDAVIVASPNHTHRSVLEPLFDAGLNILCEKPLATTVEDARWIV